MKHFLSILITFSLPIICAAQSEASDEKAINAQINAFINSWNKHDFTDIQKYTTEDIEFINPLGVQWNGRKQVQYALQSFHENIFKNTDMKKVSSDVRFLTNDIAIAHVTDHIGTFMLQDNKPGGNNDNISTYVFIKQNGIWLMTSGHVTQVDASLAQQNPSSGLPTR